MEPPLRPAAENGKGGRLALAGSWSVELRIRPGPTSKAREGVNRAAVNEPVPVPVLGGGVGAPPVRSGDVFAFRRGRPDRAILAGRRDSGHPSPSQMICSFLKKYSVGIVKSRPRISSGEYQPMISASSDIVT